MPRRREPPFVYTPAKPELIRRELQRLGWRDVLIQAYRRQTKGLRDYLRSDFPLDERKRHELADLIERKIQLGDKKGRKPGAIPVPREITERDIVEYARLELRRVRARNGGRVPSGGLRRALQTVCRRLGQSFGEEGLNVTIDFEAALAELKKRPR
jgi:hypothetical protein